MNLKLRHILSAVSLCCLTCLLASCDKDAGLACEQSDAEPTVTLALHTRVVGTLSNAESPSGKETMSSLRIVVLHPDEADGSLKVEHNECMYFLEEEKPVSHVHFLEVKRDEKKTIYLIANERSINGLEDKLKAFEKGMDGFEAVADAVELTGESYGGSLPLPMSAKYEVDVSKELEECQFYLVRAATKFTFRFHNYRTDDVTVNSLTVGNTAESMYLMPRKKEPMMEFEGEPLFWIDWLKKVADESQQYPDDKELADKRGWIKDYDIPSTTHRIVDIPLPAGGFTVGKITYDMEMPTPTTGILPPFYLPESKSLRDGGDEYGEQEYSMRISLTDGTGGQHEFESKFDNLRALFRNTHVVVDVHMYKNEISVDVIPYSEVILKPEFGL